MRCDIQACGVDLGAVDDIVIAVVAGHGLHGTQNIGAAIGLGQGQGKVALALDQLVQELGALLRGTVAVNGNRPKADVQAVSESDGRAVA